VELTGRQKEFLERFVDLHLETNQPLHYAAVAERLGVSRVTAYEMLRLLEEKGLVTSAYTLRHGGGAGRSIVVFRPTEKAADLLSGLVGDSWQHDEWQEVRERVVAALEAAKGGAYEELVQEMLVRLDDQKPPVLSAAGVTTAAAVTLNHLGEGIQVSGVSQYLLALVCPEDVELAILIALVALAVVAQLSPVAVVQMRHRLSLAQGHLAHLVDSGRKRCLRLAPSAARARQG